MSGTTVELAFVSEHHPERAVLLPRPSQWWDGRGDASTRLVIDVFSRMVAVDAYERSPGSERLHRWRSNPDRGDPVDEVTFVWGSAAEAATLLLLDVLVDGDQRPSTPGQLAAEAVRRVDARRFRRATGIVEGQQPGVIEAASSVVFGHRWRGALAYRGRLVDVRTDGEVVVVDQLPTDSEPRWAGPGGVTPHPETVG
jgi:hypothetical protein